MDFDDVVTDEFGSWTQICESCAREGNLDVYEETPIEQLLCGVEGCLNEAVYYYSFDQEGGDNADRS